MVKKIIDITYWQRSKLSISSIDKVQIDFIKQTIIVLSDKKEYVHQLSEEQFVKLEKQIKKVLNKNNLDSKYFGHKYEDDINDFAIKFFVTINYSDKTYFAYKGMYPFRQPYYQEILNFFSNIIDINKRPS